MTASMFFVFFCKIWRLLDIPFKGRRKTGSRVRLSKGASTLPGSNTAMGDGQEAMQCEPATFFTEHDYSRPQSSGKKRYIPTIEPELQSKHMILIRITV